MAKAEKTVDFVPATTFFGYPDGKTKVDFYEGVPSSTTPEYLALLREKGLVADSTATATSSGNSTKDAADA